MTTKKILNTQEKEQLIIGTILNCNTEISKLTGIIKNKSLMEKNNLYHYNMIQLYSSLDDNNQMNVTDLFESEHQNIKSYAKNNRSNYYAYFQKVYKFLDGFEPGLQKNLNESLQVDPDNSLQIDIFSFKHDLKKIIAELESKNDLENLSDQIYKIKAFAGKPIFIYGYDICNNLALKRELFEKFQVDQSNIYAICFNKTDKQILFVVKNSSKLICYDLKLDILDYYKNINTEFASTKDIIFEISNYLQQLKELIHNNIVEIYINPGQLKFTFSDNLYRDTLRTEYFKKVNENSIVKK